MKSLKYALYACLALSLTTVSCKKDDDGAEPEEEKKTATTITSDYYFHAFIDGEEVVMQDGVGFWGNGASASGGNNTMNDTYTLAELTVFQTFNSDKSAGFGLVSNFDGSDIYPELQERIDKFVTGTYTYGNENDEIEGASVYYVDKDGTYWSSEYSGANHTNSTFKITEVKEGESNSIFFVIFSAEFSCTLYDENGNTKKLTNGKGRGRAVPI